MGGRRAWEFGYSPHLPPIEAWKEPERWINTTTGLPLEGTRVIKLPTDERKIIDTDASVELVKSTLFRDDYDWTRGTGKVWGDVHHFYHPAALYEPENNNDTDVAYAFRQTPTLMGRMPRSFHNTLHSFTVAPEMPTQEVMHDYRQSYLLAQAAFSNLIRLAHSTTQASRQFGVRRQSLETGRVVPKDPSDSVAQEILRESFARHFSKYSETADYVRSIQGEYASILDLPEHAFSRPQLVARKFGRRAIRGYKNYLPQFVAVA